MPLSGKNNEPLSPIRAVESRLSPAAEHAPKPAHPRTYTLHTVVINSPRLTSFFGKKVFWGGRAGVGLAGFLQSDKNVYLHIQFVRCVSRNSRITWLFAAPHSNLYIAEF